MPVHLKISLNRHPSFFVGLRFWDRRFSQFRFSESCRQGYRDAVEDGGVEALLERPRRAPNLKNRVGLETEDGVVEKSPPRLPDAGGICRH